jgi:hypothetical protein
MARFTLRLQDDLHAEARAKAKRELRSLNAVIGRLLEKWVAGEVDLEPPVTDRKEGSIGKSKAS